MSACRVPSPDVPLLPPSEWAPSQSPPKSLVPPLLFLFLLCSPESPLPPKHPDMTCIHAHTARALGTHTLWPLMAVLLDAYLENLSRSLNLFSFICKMSLIIPICWVAVQNETYELVKGLSQGPACGNLPVSGNRWPLLLPSPFPKPRFPVDSCSLWHEYQVRPRQGKAA